jgi:uncharacterized protein (TIGR02217 family)
MFLETPRFPLTVAYGASGGPGYNTDVVMRGSGQEARNANWPYPRHMYDAALGVKVWSDLEELLSYFHVVQGRAHGFRFKDHGDFKSCGVYETPAATDQIIGTGDDNEDEFQLAKTYTQGAMSTTRPITKPRDGTVLIAVDGALQTETTHYTIDYATGIVTFITPPAEGEVVSWGGEFDVPVRFDVDQLSTVFEDYRLGSVTVPIIEVRV